MNNPRFHTAGTPAPVPADLSRREEGRGKKSSRQKLRNPLKSLDLDERIQGNPRKSKAPKRGPWQRNGHESREPKRTDRTNVAARCLEGAKPTPSKGKAF
jgi:hypothetical protein